MSTVTNFTIITAATTKLRGAAVQSYEDGTRESQVAANLYPQIVLRDLATHPWQFNTLTVQLGQLAGEPTDPNWQYQYALPFDCLQFHNAMDANGNDIAYLIESNVLLTQFNVVFAKYQQNQTESQFPAYFVDLLISHLAWEFAIPLTGDAGLEQKFQQEYATKYKFAITTDAKFNYPIPLISPQNSTYVKARNYGGLYGPYITGV